MPVEKRYLNHEEVAVYIGVSPKHVYNLVAKERIPYTRIGPAPEPGRRERRRIRFDIRAIDAWMADNAVEAS